MSEQPQQIIEQLCLALDEIGLTAFQAAFNNKTDMQHRMTYTEIMRMANAALDAAGYPAVPQCQQASDGGQG